MRWLKDDAIVIDAPPDDQPVPPPEARWPADAVRTGVCGAVSPRVVVLPDGRYRLYYTQMLPRPGFPAGAVDYDNATTRILSAASPDGRVWTPEPGVRLTAQQGGAGPFRVVSSEVVPTADGRWRMYFECCPGPQSQPSSIRSAVSDDGLNWTVEPGDRLASPGRNFMSPRIVFLEGGRCRLLCCEHGRGIISAISDDGVRFEPEPGLRIAQDSPHDAAAAFAPEVLRTPDGRMIMYYAGYASPTRACILRATSDDGLQWRKDPDPVIVPAGPGSRAWDAVKCSEMGVFPLPRRDGEPQRYRMVYEACDGAAQGQRGVWRIVSATSV